MAKTVAPTGLKISRDGNNYTFSWKIGDVNYDDGQRFWYRLRYNTGWAEWIEVSVTATDTYKTITLQTYTPYASRFTGVQFCVRGKRSGYDYSADTYYTYDIVAPNKPVVSSTIASSNVFKASFSIEVDNTSNAIFTGYEWESILVHESDEVIGYKLDWASTADGWRRGTGSSASNTVTITEDSTVISTGSHTRWFRIKSTGEAGDSSWAYTRHVYAEPYSATLLESEARLHESGFVLDATWEAMSSISRPIDEVALQYVKAVPIANMQIPANPSWQTAVTARDTSGNDSASVNISGGLEDDQCLFVRVVTTHDNRDAYSNILLVKKGELATPSGLNVVLNDNAVTVSATNNSSASVYSGSDDSVKRLFLGIIYKSSILYTSGAVVGIIPKSASQAIVNIPERLDGEEYAIEVQAFVGTYHGITNTDGVTIYTIYSDMESDKISSQGVTPIAPENVSVEVINGSEARVSWDWTWDSAEGVELSWSQDEGAWQSTEQPNTFEVKGYALNWRIKGLEVGKKYYLKVRFKQGENYSP